MCTGVVPLYAQPELLFHAPFDGTATASVAKGGGDPLVAEGLAFAPGRDGQAVRLTAAAKSRLAYADLGNVSHASGTVALWIRAEWPEARTERPYRVMLSNRSQTPADRRGSHALQLWWNDRTMRADVSDDRDKYLAAGGSQMLDGRWHHVAWTWDGVEMRLYGDGRPLGALSDSSSPMRHALDLAEKKGFSFSKERAFDRFFVGSRDSGDQFDGLVDDLRVYSEPLDPDEIVRLANAHGAVEVRLPDYAGLCGAAGENPYVGAPADEPGVIPDSDLELVSEVRVGSAEDLAELRRQGRLSTVGTPCFGTLNGVGYVEPGTARGSRLAIRFPQPDAKSPFYVFDLDYPDDKVRTADVVLQSARHGGGDYTMACGYAAGGEYAGTGRILTHRTIWWTRPFGDVALVLMTARENAPAALSAVRIYRVRSGRLPPVRVTEPPAVGGWRRSFSLYFEDPAIGADFAVPGKVATPAALCETIDRTIAVMRFTGENMFAYPGAWYQGLIGEAYNPRTHAPDFLTAWYEKFDRAGDLYVVPTLNVNNMPVPSRLVTIDTMTNGGLYASPISIHSTGLPNWGKWHNTPPNFNIAHPDVQAYLNGLVDTLLAQGARHPSFKGVALHAAWHAMLSFGSAEAGYNDYCLEAFAKATGVAVPCDPADPLRGKARAEWLRAHPDAWEKWLDWRCGVVADFWGSVARRLRARRADLKLWIGAFNLSKQSHPDYLKAEYAAQNLREMGFDGERLTAAAPNLVLSQVIYPADARWNGPGKFAKTPGVYEKVLNYPAEEATYRLLDHADFPWVGQHDRYWESAIGRAVGKQGEKRETLSCDWLNELPWRVTTVNPSGRHALRHFVLPFRYHDVLGVSKGGFLIGTYGMEPHLAKFAQEFRSLPAVKMDEFFREGFVVARKAAFDGRVYGYVVNTEAAPAEVTVPGYGAFRLEPYEFRAFKPVPRH